MDSKNSLPRRTRLSRRLSHVSRLPSSTNDAEVSTPIRSPTKPRRPPLSSLWDIKPPNDKNRDKGESASTTRKDATAIEDKDDGVVNFHVGTLPDAPTPIMQRARPKTQRRLTVATLREMMSDIENDNRLSHPDLSSPDSLGTLSDSDKDVNLVSDTDGTSLSDCAMQPSRRLALTPVIRRYKSMANPVSRQARSIGWLETRGSERKIRSGSPIDSLRRLSGKSQAWSSTFGLTRAKTIGHRSTMKHGDEWATTVSKAIANIGTQLEHDSHFSISEGFRLTELSGSSGPAQASSGTSNPSTRYSPRTVAMLDERRGTMARRSSWSVTSPKNVLPDDSVTHPIHVTKDDIEVHCFSDHADENDPDPQHTSMAKANRSIRKVTKSFFNMFKSTVKNAIDPTTSNQDQSPVDEWGSPSSSHDTKRRLARSASTWGLNSILRHNQSKRKSLTTRHSRQTQTTNVDSIEVNPITDKRPFYQQSCDSLVPPHGSHWHGVSQGDNSVGHYPPYVISLDSPGASFTTDLSQHGIQGKEIKRLSETAIPTTHITSPRKLVVKDSREIPSVDVSTPEKRPARSSRLGGDAVSDFGHNTESHIAHDETSVYSKVAALNSHTRPAYDNTKGVSYLNQGSTSSVYSSDELPAATSLHATGDSSLNRTSGMLNLGPESRGADLVTRIRSIATKARDDMSCDPCRTWVDTRHERSPLSNISSSPSALRYQYRNSSNLALRRKPDQDGSCSNLALPINDAHHSPKLNSLEVPVKHDTPSLPRFNDVPTPQSIIDGLSRINSPKMTFERAVQSGWSPSLASPSVMTSTRAVSLTLPQIRIQQPVVNFSEAPRPMTLPIGQAVGSVSVAQGAVNHGFGILSSGASGESSIGIIGEVPKLMVPESIPTAPPVNPGNVLRKLSMSGRRVPTVRHRIRQIFKRRGLQSTNEFAVDGLEAERTSNTNTHGHESTTRRCSESTLLNASTQARLSSAPMHKGVPHVSSSSNMVQPRPFYITRSVDIKRLTEQAEYDDFLFRTPEGRAWVQRHMEQKELERQKAIQRKQSQRSQRGQQGSIKRRAREGDGSKPKRRSKKE